MSPTMHTATSPATYTPESDVLDRHEYGVCKGRKQASTGSGRAWSDDEEVYLLQTRLQKMPYKHIAAHLKKTELACRLHFHQLSHGSNRRRRTTSVSSSSSAGGRSPPFLQAAIPSPICEQASTSTLSSALPDSADRRTGAFGYCGARDEHSPVLSRGVRLPSLLSNGNNGYGSNCSPRLPAILPKPAAMMMALVTGSALSAATMATRGDFTPEGDSSMSLFPAASLTPMQAPQAHARVDTATTTMASSTPSLRLDCAVLPRIQSLSGAVVDMGRLHAVYGAHRAAFWSAVAAEYGYGSDPVVLEQAWRRCSDSSSSSNNNGNDNSSPGSDSTTTAGPGQTAQTTTPLTPATPPDDQGVFYEEKGCGQQLTQDKTRISAILGIDANPRSPKEREMVRRLEEERGNVSIAV